MGRVAVIGPLPASDERMPESGVAQYLRDLVGAMPSEAEIVLLCQRDVSTADDTLRAVPTWSAGLRAPLQIMRKLASTRPEVVHLQQEFNLFGGLVPTMLTVAMTGLVRAIGCPLVITVHGVVDPADVTAEFVKRNYLPSNLRLSKAAFRLAYRLLRVSASRIIVHHGHFKETLIAGYAMPPEKITVIPQGIFAEPGVPKQPTTTPKVLVLGFLTGYKAPEAVVDVAESSLLPGSHFRFCVGENPRITAPEYRDRYRSLRERVDALGPDRATMTGFLPDEELPSALDDADVLVLPYSQCLAGSGIAALAYPHGIPICYSAQLRPLLGSGPNCFQLGDPESLVAAIKAAVSGTVVATDLFAPWEEVVGRTRQVWAEVSSGVRRPREEDHSSADEIGRS